MGIVVDSSVLINLERSGHSPGSLLQDLNEDLGISTVTASELMFGLHRAITPQQLSHRQAFVDEILDAFLIYSFDLDVAREHARLWAELASQGLTIGTRDSMIAATALVHDLSLLTDNVREFSRVPRLQVRQPDW